MSSFDLHQVHRLAALINGLWGMSVCRPEITRHEEAILYESLKLSTLLCRCIVD